MRSVIIAPQAELQVRAVDRWWRENRLASPELFAEEFAAALSTVATSPAVGRSYRSRSVAGVRRVLLRATRHHVYYVATDDTVIVLAVWGAIKGVGPRLFGLP
jgi:plasmid stabilization system protein ParE